MKKHMIFTVLAISLSVSYLTAQSEIQLGQVSSFTGSKTRLGYSHQFGKHSISIGAQYLRNSRVHNLDQDNYFKKRFYATLPTQHLGMSLAYSYQIAKLFGNVPIRLGYDFQFVRADVLNDRYVPKDTMDGITIYAFQNEIEPVTMALENNLCLEVKIPLVKNLFLNHTFGVGIITFHSIPSGLESKIKRNYEFGTMFLIGLTWSFDKI